MQLRSIDGLVNFYLPGYVRQGPAASVTRVGAAIKAKFSDTNDQTIDGFVTVRPEVIAAIGKLASGGNGMDVKASACRAIGILRGRAALPDLLDALRTKDNTVMYEALVAIHRKTGDASAGPKIVYLLRDLDAPIVCSRESPGRSKMPACYRRRKVCRRCVWPLWPVHAAARRERSALGATSMMPEPADQLQQPQRAPSPSSRSLSNRASRRGGIFVVFPYFGR